MQARRGPRAWVDSKQSNYTKMQILFNSQATWHVMEPFAISELSLCPMAPNHFPQVLSTSVVRYSPGRIQDFYDRVQSEATIYNTVSEFTLDGLRWFLPNQAVMMLYGDPQLMDFCNLATAIMWVIAPLQLVCQRLPSLVDEHSLDLEQAPNSEECRALSIKSDGPSRWSLFVLYCIQ